MRQLIKTVGGGIRLRRCPKIFRLKRRGNDGRAHCAMTCRELHCHPWGRKVHVLPSIFSSCSRDLTGISPKEFYRQFSNIQSYDDEKWNRYRQPITKELWDEFQPEVVYTRSHAVDPSLYQQIYQEIQENIQNAWEIEEQAVPEYGPTGNWMYNFVMRQSEQGETMRRYQRFAVGSDDDNASIVIELQPHEELLSMSLTPDETCIAALIQNGALEDNPLQIRIRHIESDQECTLPGTIQRDNVTSLEWGAGIVDNENNTEAQTLYLALSEEQGRPYRVVCYRIDPSSMSTIGDVINLYQSDDPASMVDVQRTKGCQYVAVQSLTKTSNEVRLCGNPLEPLVLVRARAAGVLYHLDVGTEGDIVMLVADEKSNGGNYFLVEKTVDELPLDGFVRELLKSSPEWSRNDSFFIEDMDLFKTHLVLYERSISTGCQQIQCRRRDSGLSDGHALESTSRINTKWSKLSPTGNICYHADSLRVQVESLTTSGGVLEYSFQDESLELISGSETMNAGIEQEIITVASQDGTEVPMTLYCDSRSTTMGPVVLVGYGAYGESVNLGYDPSWSSLLQRGSILAFAHTRGGGELGKSWYHDGRQNNKHRSIDDFESCAMYLKSRFIERPLTSKAFSAGGILLGALVNRQPNLFDKVVFTNAFLDVLHTMKTPSLFLTEHEYDEIGDPSSNAEIEPLIASYCPFSNLDPVAQSKTKTKFLVIGTLDDPNVPYWNATLYFQKLAESLNHDQKRCVFLDLQTAGGHNISGPNRVRVWAMENAFVLDCTK